jgi:outer membrane protein
MNMRTRTLFTLVLMAAAVVAGAQSTQKIGWADWTYIMENMPESKAMQTELQTHQGQLTNQLKAKEQEIRTKDEAFAKLPPNTSDLIKADKQRELQTMYENYQQFQQEAQNSFQKKQADLMQPILDKIQKNIEAVAKENAYSFVINPDLGGEMTTILLYADPQFNISDLVLKKMGITPPPAAQR